MKAQARHILVKTSEEAEQLKQRIAKGEAFDVLAKKYSTCPSGKRGGDLGEVRPGQMVGAIDAVIFKKPLRVVHGPIKSKFGYHLVQVFSGEFWVGFGAPAPAGWPPNGILCAHRPLGGPRLLPIRWRSQRPSSTHLGMSAPGT